MAGEQLLCGFCGQPFQRRHTHGPKPMYCCGSHRQRAYSQRRFAEWRQAIENVGSDAPLETKTAERERLGRLRQTDGPEPNRE